MGNKPVYDPQFEALKDIRRLVAARIKPDSEVKVSCFTASKEAGGRTFAYIDFTVSKPGSGRQDDYSVSQEPGIPLESLVPEKIVPIAYWIVDQMRKKHPEWFDADGIARG